MIADCTALILAGGLSTRMGRDKTRLDFDGKPLLQRTIDAMQALFPAVLVSVRELRNDIAAPQVCDEAPGSGPLAGLCSGLARARTTWVFAIAADMPFIDAAVIGSLAVERCDYEAVVPVVNGFPQPLTAFYRCAALPLFREEMAGSGRHGVRDVLDRLRVCWVQEASLRENDSELQSFIDLDTPADLARFKRLS